MRIRDPKMKKIRPADPPQDSFMNIQIKMTYNKMTHII